MGSSVHPEPRHTRRDRMRLTFLGAAGTVTGSKYLVETANGRILVDCGLFQGLKQLRLRNRAPFPVPPSEIDAVVLTHAHLDHSGYLPLLVRNGFSGPVYCTQPTADLCAVLLPDSGYLQEEEAATANRYGYSKHHPALPLYTREDAIRSLEQFEPLTIGAEHDIQGGFRVGFTRTGHMLGSVAVHLSGDGADVLFSGDLGRPFDPILPPPQSAPGARHLLIESTYGDRVHAPSDPLEEIAAVVARTAARGGAVLVPAFAVGRAQTILFYLHELKRTGRIPAIPIFLDSPMADRATEVFRAHAEETRLSAEALDEVCNAAAVTRTVEESKRIGRMEVPRVILSASGMATGGRVVHHLKLLAPDPHNTILFAGHQAAGTRGAAILGGAETVKIHGAYVPIRAEVAALDNVSAHADHLEIVEWLKGMPTAPRRTFVTHGEPVAADALRLHIEETLGWRVAVPDHGEVAEL